MKDIHRRDEPPCDFVMGTTGLVERRDLFSKDNEDGIG
jgi:hypothetical protein